MPVRWLAGWSVSARITNNDPPQRARPALRQRPVDALALALAMRLKGPVVSRAMNAMNGPVGTGAARPVSVSPPGRSGARMAITRPGIRGSLRALESAAHLESTIALIRHEETRRDLSTANEQRALQLLDELTPERAELHVMFAQTLLVVAATLPAGATRTAVVKRVARLVDGGDPHGT